MKKTLLASAAIVGLLFTGCSLKTSHVGSTVNIENINMKHVSTLKQGKACRDQFLFLQLGSGDATALEAAKDGEIEKVKYQEFSNYFFLMPFLYNTQCLTVYGE